jgi:hypothetical protein
MSGNNMGMDERNRDKRVVLDTVFVTIHERKRIIATGSIVNTDV